jgi:hypothetical protein
MSGVHSRAATMNSFSRFIIFIKSSGLFLIRALRGIVAFSSHCKRLAEQKPLVASRFSRDLPVLERAKSFSQSMMSKI